MKRKLKRRTAADLLLRADRVGNHADHSNRVDVGLAIGRANEIGIAGVLGIGAFRQAGVVLETKEQGLRCRLLDPYRQTAADMFRIRRRFEAHPLQRFEADLIADDDCTETELALQQPFAALDDPAFVQTGKESACILGTAQQPEPQLLSAQQGFRRIARVVHFDQVLELQGLLRGVEPRSVPRASAAGATIATMQLERILQSQGFGSRKECRLLIEAGLVSVGGKVCNDPRARFAVGSTDGRPGLHFSVDGEDWQYRARAYLMLHKPGGHECSNRPTFHPSVFRLLPRQFSARNVQCVGRLDQDTTGLLLLSDDGQFIHQWSSGRKQVPKLYEIKLKHPAAADLVATLLAGVQLHDEAAPIAAAACELTDPLHLELVIREGKYHQVKRMVAAAGNRVEQLHRRSVGGLQLDTALAPGQWRWLDERDLQALADFS